MAALSRRHTAENKAEINIGIGNKGGGRSVIPAGFHFCHYGLPDSDRSDSGDCLQAASRCISYNFLGDASRQSIVALYHCAFCAGFSTANAPLRHEGPEEAPDIFYKEHLCNSSRVVVVYKLLDRTDGNSHYSPSAS